MAAAVPRGAARLAVPAVNILPRRKNRYEASDSVCAARVSQGRRGWGRRGRTPKGSGWPPKNASHKGPCLRVPAKTPRRSLHRMAEQHSKGRDYRGRGSVSSLDLVCTVARRGRRPGKSLQSRQALGSHKAASQRPANTVRPADRRSTRRR